MLKSKNKKYYISVYYIMSGINLHNLQARSSGAQKVHDYVWYDISDSVPVVDADISRNARFVVADATGVLPLTHVAGSDDTDYILPGAFNLIDDLFTDQGTDPYYSSYETNYRAHTQTAAVNDISTAVTNLSGDEDHMSLNVGALNANGMTLHLDNFHNDSGRDLSENYKVQMTTNLDFFPTANVMDISNFMTVNLHYFGLDAVADSTYQLGVNGFLDLSCNALSENAVVKFVADAQKNDDEFDSYPKPSLLMAGMLPSSFALGAGRTGVSVPVTVPTAGDGLKSGAWNWKAIIEDGDYTSEAVDVRLVVAPKLSAPVVTKPVISFTHDISKNFDINVKYLPADITNADISAWNPVMTVVMTLHLNDENKTVVSMGSVGGTEEPFNLGTNWNNMSVRNTDASANFTFEYSEQRYQLANTSYILRLTYNDNKGTEYVPIEYPFTVSGVTHNDKVITVNNYQGTLTLSGGNKKNTEHFAYKKSSGFFWNRLSTVASTNTYKPVGDDSSTLFGVTDIATGSVGTKIFARTISSPIATTNDLVSIDISSGPMFGAPTTSSVIPISGEGVAGSSAVAETTRLTIGSDGKTDIYVNVAKPLWFDALPNANLVVKVEEIVPSNGFSNLLGFDLSANLTDKSGNELPGGGYQATTDTSAFEFGAFGGSFEPSIDLRFKSDRYTTTDLIVTATFNGASKTLSSAVARFTVASTIINNPGGVANNLIVMNRTKMNLTRATGGSALTRLVKSETDVSEAFNGSVDVSTNTFRNLGGAVNAMHYFDLARSEFTDGVARHTFDISGFDMVASGDNDIKPRAYFPFTQYGSTLDLTDYGDVSGFFSSNYNDIFIDFGYFTGVLDIKYSTLYENEHSNVVNTLRVYVLPRPGLTYTTIDPSQNVHSVNAPTWLRHSITNVQKDGNNAITWATAPAPLGGGSESNFRTLLDTYTSITRNAAPVFTDLSENVPDGDHFDVSESVLSVSYGAGNAVGGLIKFTGVDMDNNDVSSNPHTLYFNSAVSYLRHVRLSDRALNANSDFKIYVIDDAEYVYAPDVITNNIHMSGTLAVNNIDFVKYLAATANVNLDAAEYANTLHIIIENADAHPITVSEGGLDTVLNFAQRGYFKRDTTYAWSYCGIVGSGIP